MSGRRSRTVQHSTDNGRTWTTCEVYEGSLMWHVGSQPTTDDFGNWYRALGSTVPVGGRPS